MKSKLTWLKWLGLALLALVVLLVAGGAWLFKVHWPQTVAPRSFPQTTGMLQVPGLHAPVDVYRDAMGVPSIYADDMHDLMFAQGYIHAQERFWQMDFWRHIGSGTLSEMFGASQLETDKFLRTMGWRHVAEQEYQELPPELQGYLDAYTAGVNAWLQGRSMEEISLEHVVLTSLLNRDYQIKPWSPLDSLVWGKAMAWDLRGNMDEEIERAILLNTLPPEQVHTLFPDYPADGPTIVTQPWGEGTSGETGSGHPSAAADAPLVPLLGETLARFQRVDALLGVHGDGIGSNSWAVSGALTDTGKPYLANDPHLAIQMPSIWFQMNLHCRQVTPECPFSVGGFSFAGVPGIIIGHNERIAWGFTNTGPDVMDLFIEKVNPQNPMQYEYQGQWVDFETREEVIQVAGGEPVTITVRISRHGPIISDTYGKLKEEVDPKENPEATPFSQRAGIELPEHYAIALSWTALRPSSPFEAIWGFDAAQNWEEFRAAAAGFDVPAQNLLYADVDGNIGYQMPGLIPVRKAGDGTLPVPGWTGEYDWVGFLDFEQLPYTFNPPEGFIVTANNRVPPADYPYFITNDWAYPFRATRIRELIENAPGPIDKAYIQSMHADSADLTARVYVPLLLALPESEADAEARALLADWDYQMGRDSQAAAVYATFWKNLLQMTFNDDLPEDYAPVGRERWMQVAVNLAADPQNAFWDDRNTPEVEDRDAMLTRIWQATVDEMRREYGRRAADWPTWGELHGAVFRNQTLGKSGIGPLEALFNRGPFPTGGGGGIVNATGWNAQEGFEVTWLPSMRMIVDFSDLDASLSVHTTGESGHPYHPHYDDMAPLWASGQYYPMTWSAAAVQASAAEHLQLVP